MLLTFPYLVVWSTAVADDWVVRLLVESVVDDGVTADKVVACVDVMVVPLSSTLLPCWVVVTA